MRKNLTQKTILIFAVLAVCVLGIIGIPKGFSGTALKQALLSRINLGLDLKGGTHLILQVMTDEAVNAATTNDAAHIQTDMQQNGITVGSVIPDSAHPDTILIAGAPPDRTSDIRTVLNQRYSNQYDVASGANNTFTLTMKPSAVADFKKRTLEQAIEVIRTRVDSLGVNEPIIAPYNLGTDQILVELPGVDDPARVKDVIQSTARLELHLVQGGPWSDEQAALQALGGTVPYDSLLLHTAPGVSPAGDQVYQIKRAPEVAGTDIRDAQPSRNQNTNEPEVVFYLTAAAGNHFADFTTANKGKPLCVVLDNKIHEVANIHDTIRDKDLPAASQSKQAKDLSMLLRTGALPASIHYLQESTVGPSLGADSIRHGVLASVVGMMAVMIFMLVYYRGAGINADLALFLNLVILLGFMGYTGSVLTLPGIAGVMTIGMGGKIRQRSIETSRERTACRQVADGGDPIRDLRMHGRRSSTTHGRATIVSRRRYFVYLRNRAGRGFFAVTLTRGLLANPCLQRCLYRV